MEGGQGVFVRGGGEGVITDLELMLEKRHTRWSFRLYAVFIATTLLYPTQIRRGGCSPPTSKTPGHLLDSRQHHLFAFLPFPPAAGEAGASFFPLPAR